jgi:pyruvate dehydrogenase E1 component alpha subunit
VAAGVCRQLRDDDAVYSGHRAHGHALAKGAPMDRVMAELMGRSAGLCQGLGGSMHLVDIEHGLMGATGVVGGNLPMAAGDALAARLRGEDRVTVVFFGDGAVQAGHFSETVNLASLWELPLIFVCENNGMAEFTPRSAHTKVASVADVVAPYEFERQTVEGADVGAVWTAFGGYLKLARSGRGPFLLECSTHRRSGHYEGDQQSYRDAVADAEWAQLDPIARLEAVAKDAGWIDEEAARALTAEADAEVDRAVRFGRDSSPISPEQAAELVYAT